MKADQIRWGSKNPKWQKAATAGYGFNQVDEYKGNAFGVTGSMPRSTLVGKTIDGH